MNLKVGFNFNLLLNEKEEFVEENIKGLILIIFLFYIFVVLISKLFFTIKQLAWCISLFNSLFMSIVGVYFLFDIFPKIQFEYFTCLGEDHNLSVMHGIDNFGTAICIMFAVGNVADLILGLIFYRSELGLLTTYIHHTLYTWLMYFGITTNGIFMKTTGPFTTAFLFCTIEEVPTFILALGTIFPSLRSDLGFGITFFLFRILFHITILHHEVKCNGYPQMYSLIILTLLLHFHWFYGWVSKYLFGSKKKKDNNNNTNNTNNKQDKKQN